MVDIRIENRGRDALVRALTRLGRDWLETQVSCEITGIVDNAAMPDIVASAQADGIVVRVDFSDVSDNTGALFAEPEAPDH